MEWNRLAGTGVATVQNFANGATAVLRMQDRGNAQMFDESYYLKYFLICIFHL